MSVIGRVRGLRQERAEKGRAAEELRVVETVKRTYGSVSEGEFALIKNPLYLADIAQSPDPHAVMGNSWWRKAAVRALEDPVLLASIAQNPLADVEIRIAAINKLVDPRIVAQVELKAALEVAGSASRQRDQVDVAAGANAINRFAALNSVVNAAHNRLNELNEPEMSERG